MASRQCYPAQLEVLLGAATHSSRDRREPAQSLLHSPLDQALVRNDPAQLLRAIEFLRPSETLMYASDFPHWDFDEPEQTLRQLPAEWRDNIRWRNATEFFRLPVPVAARS